MKMKWHAAFLLLVMGLALIGCAPERAVSMPEPDPYKQPLQQQREALETLEKIKQTAVPIRDRLELACRLMQVCVGPEGTPAPLYQLGDVKSFWVDNSDTDQKFEVQAALTYASDHLYIWVQVGEKVDMPSINRAAEAFESVILPTNHRYFGQEASPGVDGDPRIYILMARNMGYSVAAYYGKSDSYPKAAVETSNEHEMFYVNLDAISAIGSDSFNGILAHEFQHMIHSFVDPNEDTWLNEGLAELASLITNYDQWGFTRQFMAAPTSQLNTWPEDGSRLPHYGGAYLFAAYFLERFGDDAVMQLVADQANGMTSVDNVLRAINATDPQTGQPITSDDLFADWVLANFLNDPAVEDGRYHYERLGSGLASPSPAESYIMPRPIASEGYVPQYGTQYVELTGEGSFQLNFNGSSTVRVVPADAHSGRYAWWSNRGDMSNTRLTHTFDLTDVTVPATLKFWLWYHLENVWDYGYVQISDDGGETWQVMRTPHTTDENPHDNAYGPGYTGNSGGGSESVWVEESIDLSPYLGKVIHVRFEVITDDAVNQPGMLIDDVRIPEIDWYDDMETDDNGWEAEGWVRVDNVLPQRFIVQMIEMREDGTRRVFRLLESDHLPVGLWELSLDAPVTRLILAISGVTPYTTEPAAYSYTLTPVTSE